MNAGLMCVSYSACGWKKGKHSSGFLTRSGKLALFEFYFSKREEELSFGSLCLVVEDNEKRFAFLFTLHVITHLKAARNAVRKLTTKTAPS